MLCPILDLFRLSERKHCADPHHRVRVLGRTRTRLYQSPLLGRCFRRVDPCKRLLAEPSQNPSKKALQDVIHSKTDMRVVLLLASHSLLIQSCPIYIAALGKMMNLASQTKKSRGSLLVWHGIISIISSGENSVYLTSLFCFASMKCSINGSLSTDLHKISP